MAIGSFTIVLRSNTLLPAPVGAFSKASVPLNLVLVDCKIMFGSSVPSSKRILQPSLDAEPSVAFNKN